MSPCRYQHSYGVTQIGLNLVEVSWKPGTLILKELKEWDIHTMFEHGSTVQQQEVWLAAFAKDFQKGQNEFDTEVIQF